MSTQIQDIIEQAGAAARAGDDATAAKCHREASGLLMSNGRAPESIIQGLCAVSCEIRVGDLQTAAKCLDVVEEMVATWGSVEDHVLETIRAKKLQLQTLRDEAAGNLVPVRVESPSELAKVVLEAAREPLSFELVAEAPTPQDILDRATGAGINASIVVDGVVGFVEKFAETSPDDIADSATACIALVRETLESVGLTVTETGHDAESVFGTIVPLPAAA